MAKGQKRTGKEAKKVKSADGKQKKAEGPKYVRDAEVLVAGRPGAQQPGKAR